MNIENQTIKRETTIELSKIHRSTASRVSARVRELILTNGFMVIEMTGIFALGMIIAELYVKGHLGEQDYYPAYMPPLLTASGLTAFFFRSNELYKSAILQRSSVVSKKVLQCLAHVFLILIVLGFLIGTTSDYSRIWFVSWAFGSVSMVMFLRATLDLALKRFTDKQAPLNRIVIFGDPSVVLRTRKILETEKSGTEIIGIFSDTEFQIHDTRFSGNLSDLIRIGQNTQIDRIVIAKEVAAKFDITRIMSALSILPAEVFLHPGFLGNQVHLSGLTSISESSLLRIQKKPISEWGLILKSVTDKVIASTALVTLAPFMLLVALAIKLDSPGPVFFRQKRNGYNQRELNIWKFRSMTDVKIGGVFTQATRNDKRITHVGAFLRMMSIDELPQLINVLRGEMSIVGPRPHPVELNSTFRTRLLEYDNRHKVKPGITGWAQINGYRGPTQEPYQMRKRIEHDLEYIENWSLWLDFKIILATPFLGLMHKNAF